MRTKISDKTRSMSVLFGLLVLVVVSVIAPHAFAQVSYTGEDDPHGALQPMAWIAGMAVAGAMSGIGIFTAIRRSIRR